MSDMEARTTARMAIIGLMVERGGKRVLSGGEVAVPSPGVALCTGPNGSGKTTLLEAVAGIIPAAGGTITLNGHAARFPSDTWRSRVSYLPSDGGTIRILTAREQLRLVMELDGAGRAESARRIARLAEVFGLDHSLDERAQSLSTGTRKRLGLAMVVATPATLFLLDEPGAGLDAQGLDTLIATIDVMRRGATVVVTSHTAPAFAGVTDVRWSIEPRESGGWLTVLDPVTASTSPAAEPRRSVPVELPWLEV